MSGSTDLLHNFMQQNIDSGQYSGQAPPASIASGIINKVLPLDLRQPQEQDVSDQSAALGQNIAKGISGNLAAAPSPDPLAAPAPAPPAARDLVVSDKRAKTNIKKTMDEDISDFLKTLTPQSFDYKDPANGSRTEAGVMAQDLQKSKIGSSVVEETGKGKAINTAKLAPLMASIFGQKINELEQKVNASLDAKFKNKGEK